MKQQQTPVVPFGVFFAGTSAVVEKVDPAYSGEKQVAENAANLGTDTYLKWTEDHDA
ncbi:MAG: hypothetical protein WAU31_03800 [Candidatus Moraniibacteriota bacterium]